MRKELRKIEKQLHMVLKAHLTGKKEFKMSDEDFHKTVAAIHTLEGNYQGTQQELEIISRLGQPLPSMEECIMHAASMEAVPL